VNNSHFLGSSWRINTPHNGIALCATSTWRSSVAFELQTLALWCIIRLIMLSTLRTKIRTNLCAYDCNSGPNLTNKKSMRDRASAVALRTLTVPLRMRIGTGDSQKRVAGTNLAVLTASKQRKRP